MTIQSGSSIRSKASRLVPHPQQDKDLLPIDKPDLSIQNINLPSQRAKGYSFNGNVLIRQQRQMEMMSRMAGLMQGDNAHNSYFVKDNSKAVPAAISSVLSPNQTFNEQTRRILQDGNYQPVLQEVISAYGLQQPQTSMGLKHSTTKQQAVKFEDQTISVESGNGDTIADILD